MNENIDLTKILKDCPKGWKFYSSIYGEVEFKTIKFEQLKPIYNPNMLFGLSSLFEEDPCPIKFIAQDVERSVSKAGEHIKGIGECTFFPSNEQRDWSKFSAPWYKKEPEHKFHVGQYITDGYVGGQITSIEDNYPCYKILDFMGGINTTIPFTLQDNYHLWTIQDAKDGDVLCCKSGWMCIFKSLNNHTNTFSSYCFMDSDKYFFNSGSECHTLDKKFINAYNGEIHPATKEQRDLLFQKIKEAGYKWNDETKTLEKLLEHKFDPKTLQPFDKVLVRSHSTGQWRCSFFSHYRLNSDRLELITAYCTYYDFCIPYNEDTKHLIGTTDEAPQYYRYWED